MFLLVAYSLWRNFCSFLCPFFNEIVLFFWLSCMDSSYIMYFEYYLPYEIDDSILLLRLPFHLVDSFLYCTALRFHLFSLVFVLAFNPKNHCPNQLTLTFFPQKFYGFRSYVYVFNLLCVDFCIWQKILVQLHSFACGWQAFPASVIEETVLLPRCILGSFVIHELTTYACIYFWLSILFHSFMCLFCFDYCGFVVYFET